MPIYLITLGGAKEKLIDANTKSQAINHAIKDVVTTKVLTPREVADAMKSGLELEEAIVEKEPAKTVVTEDPPQLPATAADATE